MHTINKLIETATNEAQKRTNYNHFQQPNNKHIDMRTMSKNIYTATNLPQTRANDNYFQKTQIKRHMGICTSNSQHNHTNKHQIPLKKANS